MRVLIVGAGAIGTMIGGVLTRAGHRVTYLDLPQVVEKIKSSKIRVEGLGDVIETSDFDAVDDIAGLDPFDLCVVAVKSYCTRAAMEKVTDDVASVILTFQNGLDNEELLSERYGPHRVVGGSITYPVALLDTGYVRIENSRGGIGLAPVEGSLDISEIVEIFTRGGMQVISTGDYRSLKWSKLLLNLICNATCAILDMTPGEIFSDRRLVAIEQRQIQEALRVMDRRRIPVMNLPGYPVIPFTALYRVSPPSVLKLLMKKKIARGRGDKKPSLLLEMEKGSGCTEVRYLNGAVYRQAFSAALRAPVNKILYETLEDIVRGFISPDDFRRNPENFLNLFRLGK